MNSKNSAYALMRIVMGVNFLGHGFVRLPKIGLFREWMTTLFEPSILPRELVYAFGTVLPFIEFIIGALLIVGLFTRQALIMGSLVMIGLVFGSCMIEKWDFAGGQMLYSLMFFLLLFYSEYNTLSWDQLLEKRRQLKQNKG